MNNKSWLTIEKAAINTIREHTGGDTQNLTGALNTFASVLFVRKKCFYAKKKAGTCGAF